MLALAIAAGLLIGLSLGALGGGGSILTVPALVYLMGMSPHKATAASLFVVGGASLIGAVSHFRAGRVRLRDGVIFGIVGVVGSYAGSIASEAVPANLLLAGFGVLMLIVAALMFTRGRRGSRAGAAEVVGPDGELRPADQDDPDSPLRAGPAGAGPVRSGPAGTGAGPGGHGSPIGTDPLPGGRAGVALADAALADAAEISEPVTAAPRPVPVAGRTRLAGSPRQVLIMVAAATVVGLVTGFFGVGGGFVVVPALVLALGFDMPTAVGTSLLVIVVNSISALISRIGHASMALNWPVIAIFTGAAIIGTIAGSAVAGRVNPRRLGLAFTLLIIAVAVYTLARSIPGLF
ncbi:MAG: sulfite exporter TauE/SafE family protein [Streptosporangiaceae bacterium]